MNTSEIILYTHNRHIYLELTLNSLLYSLTSNPEVNIHVFMVAPTPEVREVCNKKANENPRIKLYLIPNNVAFGAGNIAIQMLKPKYLTMWEDDFIIPQNTKFLLPNWNKVFVDKLKNAQVVSFSTSVENIPYYYLNLIPEENNSFLLSNPGNFQWFMNQSTKSITGNSLTTTLDTYLKGVAWLQSKPQLFSPYYFASDHAIHNVSSVRITTSIRGYHIGSNQEMDGFIKVEDRSRFPIPEDDQEVCIIKTGEIKKFKLSNILKMF